MCILCMQSTYLAQRNATELAWDFTEDQLFQTVYSCEDVPYYDNSTSETLQTSPAFCLRDVHPQLDL